MNLRDNYLALWKTARKISSGSNKNKQKKQFDILGSNWISQFNSIVDSTPLLLTEMMAIKITEMDVVTHVQLRMDFLEVEVALPQKIIEL